MISKTTVIAALAATASAAIESVQVIHIIEGRLPVHSLISVNAVTPRALFARQSQSQCLSDAYDLVSDMPEPENYEVSNWGYTELTEGECTFTAPSSLSSPIMSYLTELVDWTWEKEPEAQEWLSSCSRYVPDGAGVAASLPCGGFATFIFTGLNGTSTLPLETAFADYTHSNMPETTGEGNGDGNGDGDSAASRSVGMSAAAVFAGLVAVAFTL